MTLMSDLFDDLDKPLPDVKITCTSVSCDDDLHCFLQPKRAGGKPFFGACRGCPADPVDWPQAHQRDPAFIDELFKQQRKELIRYYMWSKPFDDAAKARARKLGWEGTLGSIRKTLRSSVGKAAGAWDGRQTKLAEDVVCYAQHSTATCCRKCIKYWHDIPMDRSLTEEELDYFELLISRYLELRKPDLD